MTEREYIDATNLAKVRAAKAILRDVLPMGSWEAGLLADSFAPLVSLEDRLSKAASIDPVLPTSKKA